MASLNQFTMNYQNKSKMKKKLFLIIAVIIFVSTCGWLIYQKQFIQNKFKAEIDDICYFYKYDKENPSVHASYGADYHIKRWKRFEDIRNVPKSKSIDEFCGM